jgi:DNA-binding response OmpR family regulator
VRDLLRAYLKGHHVVTCAKATAAFAAIEAEPFDFVLLDICIEGSVNGFQIFDRLVKLAPAPRVIFASGRFPDSTYRTYLERAHGHLLKPYKFEELAALLGIPEPQPEACAATAH